MTVPNATAEFRSSTRSCAVKIGFAISVAGVAGFVPKATADAFRFDTLPEENLTALLPVANLALGARRVDVIFCELQIKGRSVEQLSGRTTVDDWTSGTLDRCLYDDHSSLVGCRAVSRTDQNGTATDSLDSRIGDRLGRPTSQTEHSNRSLTSRNRP